MAPSKMPLLLVIALIVLCHGLFGLVPSCYRFLEKKCGLSPMMVTVISSFAVAIMFGTLLGMRFLSAKDRVYFPYLVLHYLLLYHFMH